MSDASRRAWFERHQQVNTWIGLREYSALVRLADASGLSLAAYVKELIEKHLEKAH